MDVKAPLSKDLIYDGKSLYSVYCSDNKTAQKEILIVSPFTSKSRLKQLAKVISEPILNGVSKKAIVRPSDDLPEKDRTATEENIKILEEYGITVTLRPGFHQKFTVIDGRSVWYGSINYFCFGRSEESVMRLESIEIAGELIDSITKKQALT